MADGEISASQLIGWGLTALGITISLGWNWFNQRRTIKTAELLRIEQYRNVQWTRVRGAIEKAVDGLVDAGFVIQKQAQSMDADQPGNDSIDLYNLTMIQAQDKLASALGEAERSAYCNGTEWASTANGVLVGQECSWDLILAAIAEAQAAPTKLEKLSALAKISEPISQIRIAVTDRCRIQDMEIDPERI